MHLTLVPHPGTDEMKHRTVRVSPLFGLAPAGVPPSVAAFVARTTLIVMAANFAVGSVLVLAPGGASPALEFLRHIAPLPAWGLVFALVGALGMLGRLVIAHAVAVALWAFLALGAITGLLTGTTTSPAATGVLFVLGTTVCGLHGSGLWFARDTRPRGR